MPNKKVTEEESRLFRSAVGKVRTIDNDRVEPDSSNVKVAKKHSREKASCASIESERVVEPGEKLSFQRSFVSRKLMSRLKKGRIESEETLDLHGMTSVEAKKQLQFFMNLALRNGLFCVTIIHGKGFGSKDGIPVLKNLVYQWLKGNNSVAAFVSAPSHEGGLGAVKVILAPDQ